MVEPTVDSPCIYLLTGGEGILINEQYGLEKLCIISLNCSHTFPNHSSHNACFGMLSRRA
jgi:hypothetical protein